MRSRLCGGSARSRASRPRRSSKKWNLVVRKNVRKVGAVSIFGLTLGARIGGSCCCSRSWWLLHKGDFLSTLAASACVFPYRRAAPSASPAPHPPPSPPPVPPAVKSMMDRGHCIHHSPAPPRNSLQSSALKLMARRWNSALNEGGGRDGRGKGFSAWRG